MASRPPKLPSSICYSRSKHRIPHSTEDALDLASLAAEIKPDTFGKQRVYAKASPPSNRGKGSHEAEDDLRYELVMIYNI